MSSFDRRTLLMLPLALAACGFTPVYGTGGNAQALRGQVLVDAPINRDSFLLVQNLEQRLGRASAARYALALDLNVAEEGLAVTRQNVTARINLVGTASYALRDLTTGNVVHSGSVENFTGYSTTGSTVETLAAERDARARLMTILADQITTRLYAVADLPAA
ncbi:LPS assembly lipoprotein LptE [Thalassococcus sp. S3]|uniref:LPS assembly lipoprotein LptE n=1 Tax=Thalassococcus sp. S3 TaxID=2017482 RepID=UPI0010242927|nr:LPS assembly lipoprotein LptE [Thalassococcus sp. S3]QBF33799.1 hypothetical protein CFI11_21665 [Thalassococcus sp. S3]